jgi:hypothetical protein
LEAYPVGQRRDIEEMHDAMQLLTPEDDEQTGRIRA